MTIPEILFRASSVGELMTEPQGKSNLDKYNEAKEKLSKTQLDLDKMKKLDGPGAASKRKTISAMQTLIIELEPIKDQLNFSATAKKRMRKVYIELAENRRTSIKNKYIKKGHICEEESISLYTRFANKWFEKNAVRINNAIITGEPDLFRGLSPEIMEATEIIDIKSSYTRETFWEAADNGVNSVYWWQGQCYMWLTGAQRHTIAYCCVNTPLHLVRNELFHENNEWPGQQAPVWAQLELLQNHVFDRPTYDQYKRELGIFVDENDREALAIELSFRELTVQERVYEFTFERDEEEIARMAERLLKCREYMLTHMWKLSPDQLPAAPEILLLNQ